MSNSASQRTLKNMSEKEINLFAEWDPTYLETLGAEASPATKQKIPMKQQYLNRSHIPKPQTPSTFEEWKATATVQAPQNVKKENAGPMPPIGGYPGAGHRKRYSRGSSVGSVSSSAAPKFQISHLKTQISTPKAQMSPSKPQLSPPKAQMKSSPSPTTEASMIPLPSPKKDESVPGSHFIVNTDHVEKVNLTKSSPSIGPNNQSSAPKTIITRDRMASTISPTAQVFTPKSIVASNTFTDANMGQSISSPTAEKPEAVADPKVITETPPSRFSQDGFTAPNGLFIHNRELARLSQGVKLDDNSTLYFRPSFVTDPWKGLKPMKTTCLSRYW